jgi:hypothetical protein
LAKNTSTTSAVLRRSYGGFIASAAQLRYIEPYQELDNGWVGRPAPDLLMRLSIFWIGRAELPGRTVRKASAPVRIASRYRETAQIELIGPFVTAAANGGRSYIANKVLNTL